MGAHMHGWMHGWMDVPTRLKQKEVPVSPSLVFPKISSIHDVMSWIALAKSAKCYKIIQRRSTFQI